MRIISMIGLFLITGGVANAKPSASYVSKVRAQIGAIKDWNNPTLSGFKSVSKADLSTKLQKVYDRLKSSNDEVKVAEKKIGGISTYVFDSQAVDSNGAFVQRKAYDADGALIVKHQRTLLE